MNVSVSAFDMCNGGIVTKSVAFYANEYSYYAYYRSTDKQIIIRPDRPAGKINKTKADNSAILEAQAFSAELYNNLGQLIKREKSIAGAIILDAMRLNTGIYYVHIYTKRVKTVRKIVVD